jgi:amidohydrolase
MADVQRTIIERIRVLSNKDLPKLVKLRRELHQHPELGYSEFRTSQRVARELKKLGIKVKTGVAKTGVVGVLAGKKKGKTVALRADMDALPITEETNLPYKSKRPGLMHACGHDAHMACVIGAAMILSQLKDELSGNVKLIFQPSEESPPGGAKPMIREGVLENPKVSGIFGLHCDSAIPVGKIGVKEGPFMAQADSFDIIIKGISAHGARPHDGIDAVVAASQAIQVLQTIVSRKIDPLQPVVVSLGKIQGGTKRNIICSEVRLEGTARSLTKDVAQRIPRLIESMLSGVAKSSGASFELDYRKGYPVLINHPKATDLARSIISRLFGEQAIFEIRKPLMGAEDFAFFLQKVPGTFLRLGIRNPKKKAVYPWHHPQFAVDEDAIGIGASLLAGLAFHFLNR